MQSGFSIIRANHLETLAELAVRFCLNQPLAPLQEEVFLVQSNGMADWLKLQWAQKTGISAALHFPMPSSFLFDMYRQVLDPSQFPQHSLFAKDSLQWRIFKLLPELIALPEFERPARYLSHDDGGIDELRCFQLARKMADLFDQYQMYRANWIDAWEAGRRCHLPGQDEAWQAALWRAVIGTMDEHQRGQSRAHLHRAFIDRLNTATAPPMPQRIFLFGINSMPAQMLEALNALSPHCQVLLMILSPCEGYWADRGIADLDGFEASNSLLDSWGAQGRDFLRLMTGYGPMELEVENAQEIDPYQPAGARTRTDSVICQLQQAMLENRQPAAAQQLPANPGLSFYPAYSRQREVEIVHDKMLALFAADSELQYSDVIVMCPNIDSYAPHIQTVFDRYATADARHLAYSISDRHQIDAPLYQALEYLLELPTQRLTLNEVTGLLQLPALRAAFGISEAALELILRWASATHIRWGQGADHKKQLLQLDDEADSSWRAHNSWQAGIDQLMAGYCAGDKAIFNCVSVDEVSANQGELLGKLWELNRQFGLLRRRLSQRHTPTQWAELFQQLLERFFIEQDDTDRVLLSRLRQAIADWQEDCQQADFDQPLALTQARQAWLAKLEQSGMQQQLKFNGITFCTLMPMRALPFKQVFLLGMNDGDYPRETPQVDFDLMQQQLQPGDRSRRDDDHYLFLEALMSVRDSLYISWVGFDIHKNTEKPPCTLVAQLADYIDQFWVTGVNRESGEPLPPSVALTQKMPLAAFSREYVEQASHLEASDDLARHWPYFQHPRSYDNEWRQLYEPISQRPSAESIAADQANPLTLSIKQLAGLLQAPAEVFYRDRLKAGAVKLNEQSSSDEPFELTGLESWKLRNQLLTQLQQDKVPERSYWELTGVLPAGGFAAKSFDAEFAGAQSINRRYHEELATLRVAPPFEVKVELNCQQHTLELSDRIENVWRAPSGLLLATTTASNIKNKSVWRYDKLRNLWVSHLAANASGHQTTSLLVARDTRVRLEPMPAEQAQQQLNRLLILYYAAWCRPLKLELKASPSTAIEPIDGDWWQFINRYWPTDEDDDERTEELAQFFTNLLYQPLKQALEGKAE